MTKINSCFLFSSFKAIRFLTIMYMLSLKGLQKCESLTVFFIWNNRVNWTRNILQLFRNITLMKWKENNTSYIIVVFVIVLPSNGDTYAIRKAKLSKLQSVFAIILIHQTDVCSIHLSFLNGQRFRLLLPAFSKRCVIFERTYTCLPWRLHFHHYTCIEFVPAVFD